MIHYEGLFNNLDLVGITLGNEAFGGPELVSIDLTNRCNLKCIGCWLYSPFLKKDDKLEREKKKELSFEIVKELLDDLEYLGVKRINLSGGGEPFMHPKIFEIIKYIKSKGIRVNINTNFTLLNEDKIKELDKYGVEHYTVSVWAGTPEYYIKTHPGTTEKTFNHLRRMLKFVSKETSAHFNIYNVISSYNYKDFPNMVKFAEEVGANSIEFTLIDIIPKATEFLRLNDEQRKWLLNKCEKLMNEREVIKRKYGLEIWNLDLFMKRLDPKFDVTENNKRLVNSIPCYVGWTYSRIMANGNVIPCCKAHRMPMGSLHEKSFKEIWFSEDYNEFRIKAKNLRKNDPYFRKINCEKSCDNIINNLETIERLKRMEGELDKIKSPKDIILELAKNNKRLDERLRLLEERLDKELKERDERIKELRKQRRKETRQLKRIINDLRGELNDIKNSRGYKIASNVDKILRKIGVIKQEENNSKNDKGKNNQ